jgi:hypothetical protein
MIVSLALAGRLISGRSGIYRIDGQDAEGRVWGRRVSQHGRRVRWKRVELSPERWSQVAKLLEVARG